MVSEAEEFAEQDKKVKERIDARNQLETYVYNMKQVCWGGWLAGCRVQGGGWLVGFPLWCRPLRVVVVRMHRREVCSAVRRWVQGEGVPPSFLPAPLSLAPPPQPPPSSLWRTS